MIGSRRRYPDKAKTLPKIGRVLPCVDGKDAFKALKVKNLLFFKFSIGTHILSHNSYNNN
jgi:hypothetical protein